MFNLAGAVQSNVGDGITLGLNANLMATQTPANVNTIRATGGTTATLDGYKPVTGRVYLYGTSDTPRGFETTGGGTNYYVNLDQNNKTSSSSPTVDIGIGDTYASVNVGDEFRSTQSFKVWGDYMGDQFLGGMGVTTGGFGTGPAGGIVSGVPNVSGAGTFNTKAIHQQSITSGGTLGSSSTIYNGGNVGWSGWLPNLGGNDPADAGGNESTEFKYTYQWNRVGRMVTGTGMIQQRISVTPYAPTTKEAIWYTGVGGTNDDLYKNVVMIGPIPFPVQVGSGNSEYQNYVEYDNGYGINNQSMSGVAQGVIDYEDTNGPNSHVDLYETNGTFTSGFNLPGPPAPGIVGIGNAGVYGGTRMFGADVKSQGSQYMWIKMWPNNQIATQPAPVVANGGVIPAWIKFTFGYQLNNRD